MKKRKDLYFSCDIEADGPIPGDYSMSSIGLCLCGSYDGENFQAIDVEKETFYAELKPISNTFDPEAAAVSGLDRNDLINNGQDPADAFRELHDWVRDVAVRYQGKPVFTAYPLGYDWLFTYWYMTKFAKSPFGFASFLDIKTFYSSIYDQPIARSTKSFMPKHLHSKRRHTHNALDDAQGQGELLQNIFLEKN
jgi:hypothetical protein